MLRRAGHDAQTVNEQLLTGTSDAELWPIVQQERRILLTADKGFANAAGHPPGTHHGIVLLRHPRESRRAYLDLVRMLIANVELETIDGAIVVVGIDGMRIHRGP